MHQCVMLPGQEAVVDEKIFLDGEPGVVPFEIARAIIPDAMSQRQILGARRGADRVRLNEAEFCDRATEGRWYEQRARDGIPAQRIKSDSGGHRLMPEGTLR